MIEQLIFHAGRGYAKSIFVSSTFRDMQFERDMIASKVLPELKEFAAQFGANISFTDLRWGVNTGELNEIESARKVLSVCLDEIDASKPYMLVLLGDRYGWIPDRALLEKAAAAKGYAPGELQKSVTALEIEYGALSQEKMDRCLFYFRHLPMNGMADEFAKVYGAEDRECGEKQQRLRERIESVAAGRVRHYNAAWDARSSSVTGLDDLCEMIRGDVCAMMEGEWGGNKELLWQERAAVGFGQFLREKSACCAGRERLLFELKDGLLCCKEELFVLRGASGSGKSTLMAALAQSLHNDGYLVFPFFCGNDARSTTVQDMLRQMIFYLESVLGQEKHFDTACAASRAELTGEFRRLARSYTESGKPMLIIMVDALDRLMQMDSLHHLGWLPLSAPTNIRFVFSCTDDFSLPQELPGFRCRIQEIGPLPEESRQEVIKALLRADSKGLDDIVIKEIEALDGSDNPLYLSALIQRLVMLDNEDFTKIAEISAQTRDDMKAINAYLVGMVASMPKTVEGVCVAIMHEAGERINPSFTNRITALLAASRYGLRKSDLEAILVGEGISWLPLDFARLKKYMRGYFMERPDGRIHFSHLSIQRGFAENTDIKNAMQAVFAHLKKLPAADPVRIGEIVYHAYCCDDKAFLAEYLSHADEKALDIAAVELRHISMDQSPAWFTDVIDEYAGKVPPTLSAFIVFNYANAFDKSAQDYRTLKNTLFALDKALQNKTDFESRRHQAILFNRLATIDLEDGDAAGAEKLYMKSEEIASELARSGYTPPRAPAGYNTVHISVDTGTAVLNTAAAMEAQGRLDEALLRYKELLKASKKMGRKFGKAAPRRDYVICCERIGSVYIKKMNSAKALKYYALGYAECPALIEEEDTAITRIIAATITERMGNAYRAAGMLAEAEKMYHLCMERAQEHTLETGSVEARNMLSISYEHLGVLAEIQEKNDFAMQMFREALRIAVALAEEADTKTAWQRCSIAYERFANQLMEKRDFEGALENYQKSMEISRRLAKESDSPVYQRDLSMGYHKLGTVYLNLGNKQQSCACFEQDEEISGRIAKQLNTPAAYDEWAVAIYTLAMHPAVSATYRFSLLNRAGGIWEQLYRQTRNVDFLKKTEMCKRNI